MIKMKPNILKAVIFGVAFVLGTISIILTANSIATYTITTFNEPIANFPVAIVDSENRHLQIVTNQQLQKLQMPDPVTGYQTTFSFMLPLDFFQKGKPFNQKIEAEEITNGSNIFIPGYYIGNIKAQLRDDGKQAISIITYQSAILKDYRTSCAYMATETNFTPTALNVKDTLKWSGIFMIGMCINLIMSFIATKLISRRFFPKTIHQTDGNTQA